ncbi:MULTISPECIES: hypothetical protein [unclassified Methylobacterium]|uniref:hypothetical protein n=1 Tax=unclassified Methylobacterium TaxID=2615210 RepID=UPI0037022B4E
MFGSEVIDVAIGVSFLYLFMSLIASALRELVESIFKSRAKDLERALREIVRGDNNTLQNLYNHPLIASLYAGSYKSQGRNLPSYIPRKNFSAALLDLVAGSSEQGKILSIEPLKASLTATATPNPVQRVVLNAIATAEGDLTKVRRSIEDWYDGTMDRAAGWYTRRTSWVLLALGFGAAVAFNVDTFSIVDRLMRDRPLREAIVAQAERFELPSGGDATGLATVTRLKDQLDAVGYPIGWKLQDGLPYPAPQTCSSRKQAAEAVAASGSAPKSTAGADANPDSTDSKSLADKVPAQRAAEQRATDQECRFDNPVSRGISILAGWFITALAIMLGAPFWFDLLNKFMIVRSTIKPKEKSSDEAST